jgi:hypothetical protein
VSNGLLEGLPVLGPWRLAGTPLAFANRCNGQRRTGALAGAFFDSGTEEDAQPMGLYPHERTTMTDKNQDLTGPHEGGAVDRPELRADLDPIAVATEFVSDDPSVAELVAFRNAVPDLKFAARESKRLSDEAMRLRNSADFHTVRSIVAGLTLVSLSFKALVAIWPSDNLDVVDAKLAMAEITGPHLSQEADYVPSLSAETATRIRIKRAAFDVGELIVTAGPAAPSSSDRGLADWPLRHYDLTTLLPPRGGPPVFADAQVQAWAGLIKSVPDLGSLAARVERLLATADRLLALAQVPSDDAAQLRRAAEGALISGYLAAVQVAIWPVPKGTTGVAAKKRVAKAINDRASRNDPLHLQAATRMAFEDGRWLARLVGGDRMATGMPVWIEIV